jgi:rubrerythrin
MAAVDRRTTPLPDGGEATANARAGLRGIVVTEIDGRAAGDTMDYQVAEGAWGGKVVEYQCPRCGEALQSPLSDAGTTQQCPRCEYSFATPGAKELAEERRIADEHKARREAGAAARKALETAEAERQRQLRENPPPPPREDLVWRRRMYCNACGYRWTARRSTPPARCPGCSSRDVEPIMEQPGCLGVVLLVLGASVASLVSLLKLF